MTAPRTPDFILVGAHKAGTTSLHDYFQQHPDVYMITPKGNDLLSRRTYGSLAEASEYLQQLAAAPETCTIGEASSIYLHKPDMAANIRGLFPDTKIIAVLRNPIDRAYSAWFFGKSRSAQDLAGIEESMFGSPEILEFGLYHDRVQSYLSEFPSENVRLGLFDDLVSDPAPFMRGLYGFIGVDASFTPNTARRHHTGVWRVDNPYKRWLNLAQGRTTAARVVRSMAPTIVRRSIRRQLIAASSNPIPTMPAQLKARLVDFYREDIEKLGVLTGIDLSRWLI